MKTDNSRKDLYILGGACYLIADMLSDEQLMNELRQTKLNKALARLREIKPEFKAVSVLSLCASKAQQASEKYTKQVLRDAEKDPEYTEEFVNSVIHQFAQSSDYLYNWLAVAFRVNPARFMELDEKIEHSIGEVIGTRKSDIDKAIEWISRYPKENGINAETVLNKLIQIKHEQGNI